MKKQIIIPVLAIVAMIAGITTMLPTEFDGSITRVSSSIVEWTDEELIDNSPWIVKGTIVKSEAVQEYKGEMPIVFTIWDVKVTESLKGDIELGSTIQIKNLGGQTEDNLTISGNESHKHETDELILFLDKETDPKSFQGSDTYHLVTQNFGIYQITNNIAVHDNPSKTTLEDTLKNKIKSQR